MEERRVVVMGTWVVAPNGIGIGHFWDWLAYGHSNKKNRPI